jgi:hypothetical protein
MIAMISEMLYISGLQPGERVPPPGSTRKHLNQNETPEPRELWTFSDPRTHEDSSPNWGAGMPETGSVISLIINNWYNI